MSLQSPDKLTSEISANPVIERIAARLRAATAVQVIGHVRPDGDCIGSLLTMHHLLTQLGVRHALAAQDIPPSGYEELTDYGLIREKADPKLNPDLVVYVDTATQDRGLGPDYRPAAAIINIDHHHQNTLYGELNWIEPRCAAVGEMLYHLCRKTGVTITQEMAEAMLIAITTDTGAFCFTNTGAEQHRIAACLLDAGADIGRIYRLAYCSNSLESIQIIGTVLRRLKMECNGRLIWSEVRAMDYEVLGGPQNAPENLANQLRSVRGVEVGLLFHEMPDGSLRVNARSDGTVDVSAILAEFGGGGHHAASGLHMETTDWVASRDRILAHALAHMSCECDE